MSVDMTHLHLSAVEQQELNGQLATDRAAAARRLESEQGQQQTVEEMGKTIRRDRLAPQLQHLTPLHRDRAHWIAETLPIGCKVSGWRSVLTAADLPPTFAAMTPTPFPALIFEQEGVGGFQIYPDVQHPAMAFKVFNEADVLHPELSRADKLEFLKARRTEAMRDLVKADKLRASCTEADRLAIRAAMVTRSTISTAGLVPVIHGYIYANSLFRVIGQPGSMKSFVVLDMAAAVAEGRSWRGDCPVMRGNVVIIAAEGSDGIGKRMAAWERVNGRPYPENVYVLPMPLQVTGAGWSALQAECVDFIKPVMIVGDTQARLTAGINENGSTEMGEVVKRLDEMRMATGAAVGLVHHQGKPGLNASRSGRGSSAVEAAMQSEIEVTKSEFDKHTPTQVTVRSTRQKDDGNREDHVLTVQVEVLAVDQYGYQVTSLAFALPEPWGTPKPAPVDVTALILAELAEVPELGMTEAEIWQTPALKAISGKYQRTQLHRALDKLAGSNTIRKDGARFYRPTPPDEFTTSQEIQS